MTISGVALADKIASGKPLTAEETKALEAQKEKSLKNQSIWKKEKQTKMENNKAFKIELEKERRVKAGLPEYDIQQSNKAPQKRGRGKSTRADEIKKQQQGSEALGEIRKKSHAQSLIAKAEHQAETQSASGKHIHKELKNAEKLDPGSTKNINEKELIQKAGEDFKPYDKTKANNATNVVDDVVKETGNSVKNTTKKSGGLFSKIGKFFKGKGGKAAIGAGIVALLAAGGTWIYNKVSGKKDDQPVNSNNNTTPTTPVAPTDSTEVKPPVTPTPGGNDTTPNAPTDPVKPGKDDNNNNNVPKDYVVKKGDCVWNIAKQHLKDLSNDPNYKPTDAEILKHTKELMELNKLQFEPDGYHVMIKPEDKLKLVA